MDSGNYMAKSKIITRKSPSKTDREEVKTPHLNQQEFDFDDTP